MSDRAVTLLADTNVVLDFCSESPARRSRARVVAGLVEHRGVPLTVTEVVLAEAFWVLSRERGPEGAMEMLSAILASEQFCAWDEAVAAQAIDVKRRVPGLDIADSILVAKGLVHGVEVVTNDRLLGSVLTQGEEPKIQPDERDYR
jgi:predicted nucleic acid-binding protein